MKELISTSKIVSIYLNRIPTPKRFFPLVLIIVSLLMVPLSAQASSDSQPPEQPQIIIPPQYSQDIQGPAAVNPLTVYFTPMDENTSTTVLFLYNTSNSDATVNLVTFRPSGTTYINTDINVPAGNLVRICADTVSPTSASWQDVVLVNFTTFSSYARMTLPEGVKASGYVVWNDGATYDPLQLAHTLPLMFTTESFEQSSGFFVIPVKP